MKKVAYLWDTFDAVYICTPWDYPEYLPQFLDVLAAIDASRALLVNDLSLVRWTLEKTYLLDIERKGGRIVPSTWFNRIEAVDIDELFSSHQTDRLVIKPTVGANAKDTFVLSDPVPGELQRALQATFDDRAYVVQPFIDGIQSDGDYLLMELELIEPSLYLRTDCGAAARFAAAFDERFQEFARK